MLQLQPLAADAVAEEPDFHGCGWFDSSWDLRQGLVVTEHSCADGAARALGLDGWLMLAAPAAKQQRGCAMMPG